MRCFAWTLLVVLLPHEVAAEEPRAIIERAIKARGGVEEVSKHVAVRMKVKGKFIGKTDLSDLAGVEGEILEFGERSKAQLALVSPIAMISSRITLVSDGEKSWLALDDRVQELSKESLASMRLSQYVDRVTELTDLLSDKCFRLTPLPDASVEGRPARGLNVSCKDMPDVGLYFEKESGLLVKYRYRAPKAGEMKESLRETVLSNYGEPDQASASEKLVREAKSDVTGPALLEFLRKRTPTPENLKRARSLIPKLGDDAFLVREQASSDLIALGAVALPFLREARKHKDREIARRARECLQAIGEEQSKTQTAAAIRLLGLRKPAGAVEVLLDFLPGADAELTKELQAALYAIAQAKREPEPRLLRALDDKDPLRRRIAAAALGKDGGAYARRPGRRLFAAMSKRPCKHKTWVDGKLDMEMELFDYQFFNAFEDKVFAKP